MQKMRKKMTNTVCFSTQVGGFNTNDTSKVEIVLPELYETKIVTWYFHVD